MTEFKINMVPSENITSIQKYKYLDHEIQIDPETTKPPNLKEESPSYGPHMEHY